jgi:hypothetical protein
MFTAGNGSPPWCPQSFPESGRQRFSAGTLGASGVPAKAMCVLRRSWQCNAFGFAAASTDKVPVYQKISNITRYLTPNVQKNEKKRKMALETAKSF